MTHHAKSKRREADIYGDGGQFYEDSLWEVGSIWPGRQIKYPDTPGTPDTPKPSFGSSALSHVNRNKKRYAIGAAGVAGGSLVAGKAAEMVGRVRGASKSDPYYASAYKSGSKSYNSKMRRESAHYVVPALAGAAGLGVLANSAHGGYVKGQHIGRSKGYDRGFRDAHKNRYKPNLRREELTEGGFGKALSWGGRGLAGLDIGLLGVHGGKAALDARKAKKERKAAAMQQESLSEAPVGRMVVKPSSGTRRPLKWRLATDVAAPIVGLGAGALALHANKKWKERKARQSEGLNEMSNNTKAKMLAGGAVATGIGSTMVAGHLIKKAHEKGNAKRQAQSDAQQAHMKKHGIKSYLDRKGEEYEAKQRAKGVAPGPRYKSWEDSKAAGLKDGTLKPPSRNPFVRKESAFNEAGHRAGFGKNSRDHTRGRVLRNIGVGAGIAAPVAGMAGGAYLGNKVVQKWKERKARREGLEEMSRGRASILGGGIAAASLGVMAGSTIKNKKSWDDLKKRRARKKQVDTAVAQGRAKGRSMARGMIAMDKANRAGRKPTTIVGKDFQMRQKNADGTPKSEWLKKRQESAFAEDAMLEGPGQSLRDNMKKVPWHKLDTGLMTASATHSTQRRVRDAADDRKLNYSQKPIYRKAAYERSAIDLSRPTIPKE